MLLWLPIGMILPTLCGWLLLRATEGDTPVLHRTERIVAGFVLGGVLTTYVIFLTDVTHMGNFGFLSMLLTQIILALLLGAFCLRQQYKKTIHYPLSTIHYPNTSLLSWQKTLAIVLGLWLAIKLIAGFIFLIGPAYFDDTISNWNLRGKAFYVAKHMVLDIPGNQEISSYPPSIPLLKTWLANVSGGWHEGLINSMHILWYIAALYLVYCIARRLMSTSWALLAAYLLGSVPLYVMHGASAYGDCFLSAVLFLAVAWMFLAARSPSPERMAFLRIGSIAAGLLIFTKNEALLLHVPPLLLLLIGLLLLGKFTRKEKLAACTWYALSITAVGIPWITYKVAQGLTFGNAKGISGFDITWHAGVLKAIGSSTFLMGSWSLLPILFAGLLVLRFKTALRTPLVILTGFFLMVWLGQLPIYMLTPLYVEAVGQTGYARGIIQLIPIVVLITTVLLRDVVGRRSGDR